MRTYRTVKNDDIPGGGTEVIALHNAQQTVVAPLG